MKYIFKNRNCKNEENYYTTEKKTSNHYVSDVILVNIFMEAYR